MPRLAETVKQPLYTETHYEEIERLATALGHGE
jgi:hypothetical protein